MMQADAAIIGGTGVGSLLSKLGGQPFCVPTPFGSVRGRLVEMSGIRIALLQRHAPGHRLSPHQVPYAALGYALGTLRVDVCYASAAVGSLRSSWRVGTMAICSDFLDFTTRQVTRYSSPPLHCDVQSVFQGSRALARAAAEMGIPVHEGAVYAGMNGPRYESPAEIKMLATAGGDVVGMTASSEAIAMAENGIAYGCLAIVTNLGAGLGWSTLDHGEVVDVMKEKGSEALGILLRAAVFYVQGLRSESQDE